MVPGNLAFVIRDIVADHRVVKLKDILKVLKFNLKYLLNEEKILEDLKNALDAF